MPTYKTARYNILEPACFAINFCHTKIKACQYIWLSIGSCLKIGNFDQNHGKLLETSSFKRILVGKKSNKYRNFLQTLWHALIFVS